MLQPARLAADFDHGARPRVFQMAQAEGQRVLAALGRQLVHEGFDGEHVGEGPERAQREVRIGMVSRRWHW